MFNLNPLIELDSVTLEEVDKILQTISVPTHLLVPGPSWVVMIVLEIAMLLSYLRDRIVSSL